MDSDKKELKLYTAEYERDGHKGQFAHVCYDEKEIFDMFKEYENRAMEEKIKLAQLSGSPSTISGVSYCKIISVVPMSDIDRMKEKFKRDFTPPPTSIEAVAVPLTSKEQFLNNLKLTADKFVKSERDKKKLLEIIKTVERMKNL